MHRRLCFVAVLICLQYHRPGFSSVCHRPSSRRLCNWSHGPRESLPRHEHIGDPHPESECCKHNEFSSIYPGAGEHLFRPLSEESKFHPCMLWGPSPSKSPGFDCTKHLTTARLDKCRRGHGHSGYAERIVAYCQYPSGEWSPACCNTDGDHVTGKGQNHSKTRGH